MPRTPPPPGQRRRRDQNFNQNDLARALRAARAAGLPDAKIEVDCIRKTITVIPGEPPKGGDTDNPWDVLLTNAANEKRPS